MRAGFALLLSFVLVMALALIGLGVMALGVRETAIAGTAARREQAVRHAEAAVLQVLDGWSTRRYADSLAIGRVRPVPARPGARVAITRLDTALYVIRADWAGGGGASPPPRASARAAMLVRTIDVGRLSRRFPAAVTARSVELHGGEVARDGGCGDGGVAVMAPDVVVSDGVARGDPPIVRERAAPVPGVDPFAPGVAEGVATVRFTAPSVTPGAAVAGGECRPGETNWGDPRPDHPCFSRRPFVLVPGSLTVDGGYGQGILLAHGDVVFAGGAVFRGLVVAHGRVEVREGALIHGAVLSDTFVLHDGRTVREGCAFGDILSPQPLDRAFRPPHRWWIPAF